MWVNFNREWYKIFGMQERPEVCRSFTATLDVCGKTNAEAFSLISTLELQTR